MQLFEEVLSQLLQNQSLSALRNDSKALSSRYRKTGKGLKDDETLAYLQVRMPATFASCAFVFNEVSHFRQDFHSLLDLGAGPGTASFSASRYFPSLQKYTLIEKNHKMAEWGQALHHHLNSPPFEWIAGHFEKVTFQPHDLVIFSYSLAECFSKQLLEKAWANTLKTLVIIEPGTSRHFKQILEMRQRLIELGATLLAPCPHRNECPMKSKWCHFSTRLPRSKTHRFVKGAALGYEDEKFCYLIASKQKLPPRKSTVIHTPLKRSGHTHLDLCTPQGIVRKVVTRKDPQYREAAKLQWGDEFSLE